MILIMVKPMILTVLVKQYHVQIVLHTNIYATRTEINQDNDVWDLVDLLGNFKPIGYKWATEF